MLSVLSGWLQPTYDAFFNSLPFDHRWRLLLFQPLAILINLMKHLPWILSDRYTVHQISTREGRSVRAIVFQPPRRGDPNRLRPLHVDVHGGAFIGGIAEANAAFCALVSDRTGAVVVSTEHRVAPRYTFPAAHDDVDDVISFLLENAQSMFGADPKLLTVSGFSAGSNLALAASQQKACQPPADTAIKASVTFYAPVSNVSMRQRNRSLRSPIVTSLLGG